MRCLRVLTLISSGAVFAGTNGMFKYEPFKKLLEAFVATCMLEVVRKDWLSPRRRFEAKCLPHGLSIKKSISGPFDHISGLEQFLPGPWLFRKMYKGSA